MSVWRSLLAELATPSAPDESPYLWMLVAIGHAVAGAALAQAVPGVWPAVARAAVPVAYWLTKERADLRRGGRVADGLVDAAFVALGTFHGAWWWPVTVLALATGGALLRRDRQANP